MINFYLLANLTTTYNLLKIVQNEWKMVFNPDPNKQAVEHVFLRRESFPSTSFFNGVRVTTIDNHKHLGLTLDSKLTLD